MWINKLVQSHDFQPIRQTHYILDNRLPFCMSCVASTDWYLHAVVMASQLASDGQDTKGTWYKLLAPCFHQGKASSASRYLDSWYLEIFLPCSSWSLIALVPPLNIPPSNVWWGGRADNQLFFGISHPQKHDFCRKKSRLGISWALEVTCKWYWSKRRL